MIDRRRESSVFRYLTDPSAEFPYAYQKALSLVSAISQVVRLASFAPAARFLQMELGAPDMASLGGLTPTPQVNLGSYSFALGPPEC